MTDRILQHRRSLFRSLLSRHQLRHALVLDPADGVLGTWFLGGSAVPPGPGGVSAIPIQLPFDRNTAYIVPAEGEILRYSQLTPHPTDPLQYPPLPCEALTEVFGHGPVGIVHGSSLKRPLRDALKRCCPDLAFVDLTEELEALKAQKCPEEAAAMRAAARLYDRTFSAVGLALRTGRTEHDAAADIRFRFYQRKVSTEDMGQMLRLKIRSAPQGAASIPAPLEYPGRRLTQGDRINVAVSGYTPDGYTSALGRCYTLGKASDETRRYWELAVRAQDIAASKIRPGACLEDLLPAIEREVWLANGLAPDTSVWICGMGVDRCEAPNSIGPSSKLPFSPGMTLAVGPKITPAGKDSYCCLDMYLVTGDGCERITNTPRNLIEL